MANEVGLLLGMEAGTFLCLRRRGWWLFDVTPPAASSTRQFPLSMPKLMEYQANSPGLFPHRDFIHVLRYYHPPTSANCRLPSYLQRGRHPVSGSVVDRPYNQVHESSRMDPFSVALLKFLECVSQDAGRTPQEREVATYVWVSFSAHKNVYRLMAQVSEFMAGELRIPPSHRANGTRGKGADAVHLNSRYLQAIVSDFRVTPTIADLEGHPIELISILDPAIERSLQGENRFRFHKALLAMEKVANDDLARCTRKYGYHYVFRAGLQEYYMT